MTRLIRSELAKVTGTRLAAGMLAAALGIVVLAMGVTLWGPSPGGLRVEGASSAIASADDLVALLGVVSVVGVFALLLGVTFASSEFRHGTAATTFLAEPRRWRVTVAKAVAVAVTAGVYAVAALAVASAVVWVYAATAGVTVPVDADVVAFGARTAGAVVLSGILGVGVGTAVRSQVGAIVAVLIWMFVVESLLGGFLPDLARWAPVAAGNAMTVSGDGQLGVLAASLVSVGYGALALVAGAWLVERRDATGP